MKNAWNRLRRDHSSNFLFIGCADPHTIVISHDRWFLDPASPGKSPASPWFSSTDNGAI